MTVWDYVWGFIYNKVDLWSVSLNNSPLVLAHYQKMPNEPVFCKSQGECLLEVTPGMIPGCLIFCYAVPWPVFSIRMSYFQQSKVHLIIAKLNFPSLFKNVLHRRTKISVIPATSLHSLTGSRMVFHHLDNKNKIWWHVYIGGLNPTWIR